MIRGITYLWRLFRLARTLRRYGALRALSLIEIMPPLVPALLRAITFYMPHRFNLPADPGERLAQALAAMGPSYIKLGQTLATRPDVVGRQLAKGLLSLQDSVPPFDERAARRSIERALGGQLEDHFSAFNPTPVAAASIAQVHKAVTSDGNAVAVKVIRPGIGRRFDRDLALFDWLARLAMRHSAEARRLRLTEAVAKVRETVSAEMDFRQEATAATQLAETMAAEPGYRIPSIDWGRTSKGVLTLEWVDGIKFADRDALEAAGFDLPALGSRIVQIFLKQAMVDGFFHGDLHQGNLIVEADGTIVAIDFGIMGRLSRAERRYLAEILYGFIQRDYARVAQLHFDAGYVPQHQDKDAFAQALRMIADPIMDLPVEDISAGKLLAQLFATTERFEMQTQPQLMILQRSMVMAEGLSLHLNPKGNMWQISRPVLEDWMRQHMSPEMRLAEFLKKLPRLAERLPKLLDHLLEDEPGRPVPAPIAASVEALPPVQTLGQQALVPQTVGGGGKDRYWRGVAVGMLVMMGAIFIGAAVLDLANGRL